MLIGGVTKGREGSQRVLRGHKGSLNNYFLNKWKQSLVYLGSTARRIIKNCWIKYVQRNGLSQYFIKLSIIHIYHVSCNFFHIEKIVNFFKLSFIPWVSIDLSIISLKSNIETKLSISCHSYFIFSPFHFHFIWFSSNYVYVLFVYTTDYSMYTL